MRSFSSDPTDNPSLRLRLDAVVRISGISVRPEFTGTSGYRIGICRTSIKKFNGFQSLHVLHINQTKHVGSLVYVYVLHVNQTNLSILDRRIYVMPFGIPTFAPLEAQKLYFVVFQYYFCDFDLFSDILPKSVKICNRATKITWKFAEIAGSPRQFPEIHNITNERFHNISHLPNPA